MFPLFSQNSTSTLDFFLNISTPFVPTFWLFHETFRHLTLFPTFSGNVTWTFFLNKKKRHYHEMLLMTLFSTYFCYFFHESVPQLYYYIVIYFLTFSPSFPLFSGNVTLTLFVENKRNILWKKILSTFFSKFQFFDHFPNIFTFDFFLEVHHEKIQFFFLNPASKLICSTTITCFCTQFYFQHFAFFSSTLNFKFYFQLFQFLRKKFKSCK